jgi:hypothetical protein
MYKIVGADGNHYGPVSAEQVRNWFREGRANSETLIQPEGQTEWKKLGELPEFADLRGPVAPMVPPLTTGVARPVTGLAPADQVRAPALGLIGLAILGFVLSAAALIINLAGISFTWPGLDPNTEVLSRALSGTVGAISWIVNLLLSGLIYWGAAKMKNLENYPMALTASILAVIPCFSPCCIIGIPLGIWALVVLSKPEVKAAFH